MFENPVIVTILLATLVLIASLYAIQLLRIAYARSQLQPRFEAVVLGSVTNFFDTLGIGSFAPTTAWLRLRKLVPDSFIPATLNTGQALPTVCQALIFIKLVDVDPLLLIACIVAAVAGATLGVPLVQRLSVRAVQKIVGIALLIAALLYALTNVDLVPAGGNSLALSGWLFAIAVVAHFFLGTLMTFGIGLYAPSLILLSLLGLNPTAAFPVMMGACAFLMPASATRFIRTERIDLRIVLGLALGGIPAVMLAAFVVRSLPLTALRWGVVAVVLYAAAVLLKAAFAPRVEAAPAVIEAR
ncbi:TSUP family transporter [Dokdonella sp.]|uniref:TSUP family transporter n=1 Tax=Dokdonella sp. TaxID=2291710 RepID=UPI0035294CE4